MRRLGSVAAAFALALASVGTAAANHAWNNYHWERSSNPVQLALGNNLTGNWIGTNHLAGAITDWNKSAVLDLTEVAGAGLDKCGAVAGGIEVCNGSFGMRQGGWVGLAEIWVSGDHITQARVKMNDTFLYGGGTYDSPAWRQMVMCQEVGHTFGLEHQDENFYNANLGTCMDYTLLPATNQHPDQHDYDELATIYSHLDGGGGGGGGTCHGRNPNCSGGFGSAPSFAQASRANGNVYRDLLPGGLVKITFVIWA